MMHRGGTVDGAADLEHVVTFESLEIRVGEAHLAAAALAHIGPGTCLLAPAHSTATVRAMVALGGRSTHGRRDPTSVPVLVGTPLPTEAAR